MKKISGKLIIAAMVLVSIVVTIVIADLISSNKAACEKISLYMERDSLQKDHIYKLKGDIRQRDSLLVQGRISLLEKKSLIMTLRQQYVTSLEEQEQQIQFLNSYLDLLQKKLTNVHLCYKTLVDEHLCYKTLATLMSEKTQDFKDVLRNKDDEIRLLNVKVSELKFSNQSLMDRFPQNQEYVHAILKKALKKKVFKKMVKNEFYLDKGAVNAILFSMDKKMVKKITDPFTLKEEKSYPVYAVAEKLLK
jgi:hypothetical protein